MDTLNLTIAGMSCGHCVGQVTNTLSKLEGVTVESVRIGSAAVQYDPGVQSPQDIAAAVTDAGYEAAPAGSAA